MHCTLTPVLATVLMMFPQVVETLYSPALPDIALGFNVSAETAAQTLSCYFLAFAVGIIVWGVLCDRLGRRPVMLAGLALYGTASVLALCSTSFTTLLMARMLAAFGAAVGSVVTQAAMRDVFSGAALARVFSLMGIAMAISPAIGVLSGASLVYGWGYPGCFIGLAALAAVLLGYAYWAFPETRPVLHAPQHQVLYRVLYTMLKDHDIWLSAVLIALFNLTIFSYYQQAPFLFATLALPQHWFGYTGLLLAAGASSGALLNHYLLSRQWSFQHLMLGACAQSLLGSAGVWLLSASAWWIWPMWLVASGYSMAIPHLLARALRHYPHSRGAGGALLGLLYYSMLGGGLTIAAVVHDLGTVLVITSLLLTLLMGYLLYGERRANRYYR